jgi:hypothetical protein
MYYIYYSAHYKKWSQVDSSPIAGSPAFGATALRRICAAEMRHLPGRTNARRGRITKGGPTMSEVLPFPPKPPTKTIEEETKEFLAMLERIRSQAQKSK